MLFGAKSHYMQTLHVDCKSFENDKLRYETDRYGAMNVTGVFF